MLKYIELKTGYAGNGPAWVARVRASKSGRTIYFNGKALKRAHLPTANHYDVVNREAYWVSGIRKDGLDRHWAGSGRVAIEAGVVEEYLRVTGSAELDPTRFEVIKDIEPTEPAGFHGQENATVRSVPPTPRKRATVTGKRRAAGRETILEVGAEGGSLSIVRTRESDVRAWRFVVLRNETTLTDMLDDNEQKVFAFMDASGAVDALAAALQVMNRYPWHRLMPLKLHEEYRGAVLAEVLRRGGAGEAARWESELPLRSGRDAG